MRGRAWVVGFAVVAATVVGVAAEDQDQAVLAVVGTVEHFQQNASDVEIARQSAGSWIEPRVSQFVPDSVRDKLETAFSIAVSRVVEVDACAELFADLDTTGTAMLSTTIYYAADPRDEAATCRRGSAFTWVGAAPTRVCRRFATLSDREAAMVVIHEALHHAGLDEQPRDRKAMSSRGINQMVRAACGL